MANRGTTESKQKGYLGKFLVAAGLLALAADLSFLLPPFELVAARFKDGLLGILPTLGVCILNATQAIAFHQVNYVPLASHILILFSAMVSLVAGIGLLRPKSARVQIIELVLSPEFEGREITNGSSR